MNKDFSIVIQGPLNNLTISNYAHYLRFAKEVIYSYWYCNNDIELRSISRNNSNIKLIRNKVDKIPYNQQNVFCQCYTTLKGLEGVTTKYSIKLRSDEYYENLEPFIRKVASNSNKLVTNNVFFRYTKEALYHPSDHLVGGTTENMLATYKALLVTLEIFKNAHKIIPRHLGINADRISEIEQVVAEQLLAISFLHSKNVALATDLESARQIMVEYFDCVNVAELGEFIVRSNSLSKYFTATQEILKRNSISRIEDL